MKRKERAAQLRRASLLTAQGATDKQALQMPSLYDLWKTGVGYGGEDQPQIARRPGNKLYRCIQPHTAQAGWEPENTPAMWEYIDVEHAGTIDDPIPAAVNMICYAGKYYSEGEKLYLCTRDSEIPLAYLPSQLVGHYFEEVAK